MRNGMWVGGGVLLAAGITALVVLPSGEEPAPRVERVPPPKTVPQAETWVQILVEHPGSALEIERAVTNRIEELCQQTESVLGTRSLTLTGHAEVTIRFGGGTTWTSALDRVSAQLEELRKTTPEAALFTDVGPPSGPLTYIVAGPVPGHDLSVIARDLSKRLATLPGVGRVVRRGDLDRQVDVTLDAAVLRVRGVRPGQVVAALERAMTSMREMHGETGDGDGRLTERDLVSRLGDVVLVASAGGPVHLRDVAQVTETSSRSRGYAIHRGDTAVIVEVTVSAAAASQVLHEVQALSSKLPEDVRVVAWSPETDRAVMDIEWGLPPGTSGDAAFEMIARLARTFTDARVGKALVWIDGADRGRRGGASVHLGSADEIPALANALGGIPALDLRRIDARGPDGRRTFVLHVGAADLNQLQPSAMRVAQSLEALRGVSMVAHDAPTVGQSKSIKINHVKVNRLGLMGEEVVAQMQFWLGGRRLPPVAGLPIVVRLTPEAREMADITIQAGDARVPLSEVADLSLGPVVGRIHHVDGRRTATITALLAPDAKREDVLRAARSAVAKLGLPQGALRWEDPQADAR